VGSGERLRRVRAMESKSGSGHNINIVESRCRFFGSMDEPGAELQLLILGS